MKINAHELMPVVTQAIDRPGVPIPIAGPYSMRIKGMWVEIDAGSARDIGKIMVSSKDGCMALSKIKVDEEFRKNGIGALLVALCYCYGEAEGATRVKLGEQDTSGRFWGDVGLAENAIPIEQAWEKLLGGQQERLRAKLNTSRMYFELLVSDTLPTRPRRTQMI